MASRKATARPRAALTRLVLTEFRCYAGLRLDVSAHSVVLTGPNGAGKTNLLEAISLLAQGRGLRRAPLDQIGRRSSIDTAGRPWSLAATLMIDDLPTILGTGYGGEGGARRALRIDGAPGASQRDLAERVAIVWLTPEMDRLFLEGPSARRRFLDRLVVAFDPDHVGRVRAYDHCQAERQRLLAEGGDATWLAAVEDGMARHGVAVAAARAETSRRLSGAMGAGAGFARADLSLAGDIDRWLETMPALAVEDRLRATLESRRAGDREQGTCAAGPHRSDLVVRDGAKDRPARECSTGEQKALLIAIILAHAAAIAEERGQPPILLFDEIVAHLDAKRRASLFDAIATHGTQAWLTGTDEQLFADLAGGAQFLRVREASVSPR